MTKKKADVWAPVTNTGTAGRTGGRVSFEAYFLRDLYAQGKVTDQLIKDVVQQEGLTVDPDEVIKALADHSSTNLPRALSRGIAELAEIISDQN